MAAFDFQPAVRENVSLLIALAGASGSGKTYSALRLAMGLAPTGKIAFIDTEARRGLHYADQFQFIHADMRPPFRPENFLAGIKAAEKSGAEVIIIDSFSHEYDGEGGIMDWATEIEAAGTKSPGNWKVPKLAHKKLMNALLQLRASVIFCLRADEKIKIAKDDRGKTVVEQLGWMPIAEKRFIFEMTASFTLIPNQPGVPQFDLPHKLQKQHRHMFPAGQPIGEDAGRALAAWARGGTVPAALPSPDAPLTHPTATLAARADKLEGAMRHAVDSAALTKVWDAGRDLRTSLAAADRERLDQLERLHTMLKANFNRPAPDYQADDFPGDRP